MEDRKTVDDVLSMHDKTPMVQGTTPASGTDIQAPQMSPDDIQRLMKFFRSKMPCNGLQQKKKPTRIQAKFKRQAQRKARKKNRS